MNTYKEDHTEAHEALWRAWVQRGKLRDAAAARNLKVAAGFALGLAAAAMAVYLVFARQAAI